MEKIKSFIDYKEKKQELTTDMPSSSAVRSALDRSEWFIKEKMEVNRKVLEVFIGMAEKGFSEAGYHSGEIIFLGYFDDNVEILNEAMDTLDKMGKDVAVFSVVDKGKKFDPSSSPYAIFNTDENEDGGLEIEMNLCRYNKGYEERYDRKTQKWDLLIYTDHPDIKEEYRRELDKRTPAGIAIYEYIVSLEENSKINNEILSNIMKNGKPFSSMLAKYSPYITPVIDGEGNVAVESEPMGVRISVTDKDGVTTYVLSQEAVFDEDDEEDWDEDWDEDRDEDWDEEGNPGTYFTNKIDTTTDKAVVIRFLQRLKKKILGMENDTSYLIIPFSWEKIETVDLLGKYEDTEEKIMELLNAECSQKTENAGIALFLLTVLHQYIYC